MQQSRWEPPLGSLNLSPQKVLEKVITTDYKVYAPGIIIPPGAERAITRGGKTTIISIDQAKYYSSYTPDLGPEDQSHKYEYLFLSLALGTPEGSFESIWHGVLVLRKPMAENHWDNTEVFTPLNDFSKKMTPHLSDEEIGALLEKRPQSDVCFQLPE